MGQSTDDRHQPYTYYEEKTPRTGVGRLMDHQAGWGWLGLVEAGWDWLGLIGTGWD